MTPADEIFDVVNERDEVIGRRSRSDVHRLGLRHRAVHVLVFNGQGKIFLQKRSSHKDTHPGVWDSSASGHVGAGEDYDTCALRELQEELGWTATVPLQALFKIDARPATGHEFVWVYRCRAEGPFVLQPQEIEIGDWFPPQVVDCWLAEKPAEFAPSFAVIWSRLDSSIRPE